MLYNIYLFCDIRANKGMYLSHGLNNQDIEHIIIIVITIIMIIYFCLL